MSVEIKAGQIWEHVRSGDKIEIKWAEGKHVLARRHPAEPRTKEGERALGIWSTSVLLSLYRLEPEKKTRYITEADLRKMLAVNPVLWRRLMTSATTFCDWELMTSTEFYPVGQYSHNPFAPNPVIVGPEIEVME